MAGSYSKWFAFLLIPCICSCSITKPSKAGKPTKLEDVDSTALRNGVEANQFVGYKFRKTACYGNCPVFQVEINASGLVSFTGFKYTPRLGKWQSTLSSMQFSEFETTLKKVDFFKMPKSFPENSHPAADLPETLHAVTIGEKSWQIVNNHDAPPVLLDFERFILELLEKLDWEKVGD